MLTIACVVVMAVLLELARGFDNGGAALAPAAAGGPGLARSEPPPPAGPAVQECPKRDPWKSCRAVILSTGLRRIYRVKSEVVTRSEVERRGELVAFEIGEGDAWLRANGSSVPAWSAALLDRVPEALPDPGPVEHHLVPIVVASWSYLPVELRRSLAVYHPRKVPGAIELRPPRTAVAWLQARFEEHGFERLHDSTPLREVWGRP